MKREKFNALQRGDLIQHFNGNSYVVIDSNGRGRVTVARTIDAMNPDEWERVPDVDDPRFRKPSTPEPEAGFGMGEPESTPATWKRPTPVEVPAEVPADGAGAGVLHIPNRCSNEFTPENVRLDPTWVDEADAILKRNAESRTSSTISYTTTTNPAEPLARLILQSAAQSASPADVRRVANVLEHVASAARNDRPTADVFRDAQRRLADLGQPVFGATSNVVSETVRSTPDHVLAERKRLEREFAARQQPASAVPRGSARASNSSRSSRTTTT